MDAPQRRPKVAVVLGSGGIKAFSAIPLFEFLDERGIGIDLLVGCSGGGLVAATRGAGFSTTRVRDLIGEFLDRKIFSSVDYRTFMGLAHMPLGRFDLGSGILKADRIRHVYQTVFRDLRLEDLRPTTLIQATDVVTGEGVVLREGRVAEALTATSAAFPLLPPVRIAGQWLVDGAFSSSLPVMEAVKRDMDVIIAVLFRQQHAGMPDNFFEHVTAFLGLTCNINEQREMALAVSMHHHEIVIVNVRFDRVIHMWDRAAIPYILETGQRVVDKNKQAILWAMESFGKGGVSG